MEGCISISSKAEIEPAELRQRAAETIYEHIQEQTKDVDLSKYEEVEAKMAITQICGLSQIHRQTWYNRGVAYILEDKYKSVAYEVGEGIVIDAKKFLEEYSSEDNHD